MATALTVDRHLDLLAREGELMTQLIRRAETGSGVPTCPGWTVRDLVAHQGEVHRWATDTVTGRWSDFSPADQADRVAAPLEPGLTDWFSTGVDDLLVALSAAAVDLQAAVFLKNPPSPRQFWARRQVHETTIHRVDVLSAALGRYPTAAEADIPVDAALDGIDELLAGFVPRRKTKLRSAAPFRLAVEPSDADRRWLLQISDQPVLTMEIGSPADATFHGTAAELYLGLWNRGHGIEATGRPGVLAQWREQMQVSWL